MGSGSAGPKPQPSPPELLSPPGGAGVGGAEASAPVLLPPPTACFCPEAGEPGQPVGHAADPIFFFLSCGERFALSELGSSYLQQVPCWLASGVCTCGMKKGVTPGAPGGPALSLAWGSPAPPVGPTPRRAAAKTFFCLFLHTHTEAHVYPHTARTHSPSTRAACSYMCTHLIFECVCVCAHTHTPGCFSCR